MGDHIRPEGWNNWGSTEKERTVYYAEGGNTGPGADTANRVRWAKVLPDEGLNKYCAKEVLKPFLLPKMVTSSWEAKKLDIPSDTTYTLKIAYQKYKRDYPFIRAAEYDRSKGTMRQADICYHSVDGRLLSLDIFSTAGNSEPPKPAVLLIHGGGWSSGDKTLMYPLADYLSNHGYIAIPVEYRLSPEAKYPAAVDDLKNAITWILKNGRDYNIDTNKIVILGCSAGAQLAGLVGLTYGIDETETAVRNRICAIVNIDGVMDFISEKAKGHQDDSRRKLSASERWFGCRYSEKSELWNEACPVNYVNKNSPPILFINSSQPRFHAGRDEVIRKLNTYSIYSEVHTFDDAPHSFWLFEPWFENTGMLVVRFLEKTL
jgi:pectinesterase